jgi:hypothetical protein
MLLNFAALVALVWLIAHEVSRLKAGVIALILVGGFAAFLMFAASTDWLMSQTLTDSFTVHLTRPDAFYFATTLLTTAGSDVYPDNGIVESVISVQTILGFAMIAGAVTIGITRIGELAKS